MDLVLKGITDYISGADRAKDKKFSVITYSDNVRAILAANKLPALVATGIIQQISSVPNMSFKSGDRSQYDIELYIAQSGTIEKDVTVGSKSVWQLWNYVWGIITEDNTFGSTVSPLREQTINCELRTIEVENKVKIVLRIQLQVHKHNFN